ncbi:MAG: hypothetical protein AB8B63_01750 [Granulosicoccus sp.]
MSAIQQQLLRMLKNTGDDMTNEETPLRNEFDPTAGTPVFALTESQKKS